MWKSVLRVIPLKSWKLWGFKDTVTVTLALFAFNIAAAAVALTFNCFYNCTITMSVLLSIYLSYVGEKKVSMQYHFSKDASQTPDVDGCGVVLAPQKDFRRSVPKSDHLETITDTNRTSEHNNQQRNTEHVETDPSVPTLSAFKVSRLINTVQWTTAGMCLTFL